MIDILFATVMFVCGFATCAIVVILVKRQLLEIKPTNFTVADLSADRQKNEQIRQLSLLAREQLDRLPHV